MADGLTSTQIQAVVAALAEFDCGAIYLFGSRAAGTQRPNSDVDIAFLPARPSDPLRRFELANRLSDLLGNQVDLIDLRQASTVLAKEVVTKGIALFTGNTVVRQSFEMYTLSDYSRLNEERLEILTP